VFEFLPFVFKHSTASFWDPATDSETKCNVLPEAILAAAESRIKSIAFMI